MSDTAENIAILPHNVYFPDLRQLLDLQAEKKSLDARSHKLEGMIKGLRAVITLAMRGASVARCGPAIVTVKPERINPGALTLTDGRSVPLADVSEIVFNNAGVPDVIFTSEVKTWFGGSVVGPSLDIIIVMTGENG